MNVKVPRWALMAGIAVTLVVTLYLLTSLAFQLGKTAKEKEIRDALPSYVEWLFLD